MTRTQIIVYESWRTEDGGLIVYAGFDSSHGRSYGYFKLEVIEDPKPKHIPFDSNVMLEMD